MSNVFKKRERTLPIRRTRSVPTLIDKDGNVTPVGVLRVIPTPPRVDIESLEMMHEHDNGGEDVPEEEALCRICMVELGQDSEAFNMECMCKGELALAHRECTIKWFTIKGNITCDVCKQDVKNLPLTLLRVKDPQDRSSREAEHTWISEIINEWQGLPSLVMVKQPVSCIVVATMVGFGLTMSGTVVITVFMEWRRSNSHHQPSSTQVATPPFQTTE
uniref:RING-CH-type domain-containing protein n=1 Tax=Brassica oleracea var. oleracea TaxID=109376 RepID=A0A0D3EI73_BRAOL